MLLCCKFGMNRWIAQRLCKYFLGIKLELTGCQFFLCKIHDTLNYISIVFFQCQQQFEAREYFTCLDVACEGSKSGQVLWWLNILFSLPTLTCTESGCCRKLSFLQEFIRKKQWALQVSLAKPFTIIGIHLPDQIDVSACRGYYSITRIC